jgi:hypothetical protein
MYKIILLNFSWSFHTSIPYRETLLLPGVVSRHVTTHEDVLRAAERSPGGLPLVTTCPCERW